MTSTKVKLKTRALEILWTELQPNEMSVIYLMRSGGEIPETVSKSSLTRIISVLFKRLDWIVIDQDSTEAPTKVTSNEDESDYQSCEESIDLENQLEDQKGFKNKVCIKGEGNLEMLCEDETTNVIEDSGEDLNQKSKGNDKKLQSALLHQDKSEINLLATRVKEAKSADSKNDFIVNDNYNLNLPLQEVFEEHDTQDPLIKPKNEKPEEIAEKSEADQNGTVSCSRCNKTFTKLNSLRKHERNIHREKNICCSHCDKRFTTNEYRKQHERTHTGDQPFNCSYCGKKFSDKSNKRQHEKTHNALKHLSCTICDKKFSRPDCLRKHERTHTGEKTHSCQYCSMKFLESSQLKRHVSIHTGEKPFKCSSCDKGFRVKDNLKSHEFTHSKDKTFRCSYCDRKFIQPRNLKRHEKIHNSDKPTQKFSCLHCDKNFTSSSYLKEHERTHTGAKPNSCPHCEKKFSKPSVLRRHVRQVHTGDRPFKCSVCDKRFTSEFNLKRHDVTHTKEKLFSCTHCEKKFSTQASATRHQYLSHERPFWCSHCDKTFVDIKEKMEHEKHHSFIPNQNDYDTDMSLTTLPRDPLD